MLEKPNELLGIARNAIRNARNGLAPNTKEILTLATFVANRMNGESERAITSLTGPSGSNQPVTVELSDDCIRIFARDYIATGRKSDTWPIAIIENTEGVLSITTYHEKKAFQGICPKTTSFGKIKKKRRYQPFAPVVLSGSQIPPIPARRRTDD